MFLCIQNTMYIYQYTITCIRETQKVTKMIAVKTIIKFENIYEDNATMIAYIEVNGKRMELQTTHDVDWRWILEQDKAELDHVDEYVSKIREYKDTQEIKDAGYVSRIEKFILKVLA